MSAAAEIGAALAALCPPDIGCAAVALADEMPPLWPGEAAAVATALPARRREFSAGRAAARLALNRAGIPPTALPARADRSPDWPPGLRGSIAHTRSFAIATAGPASAWAGIGVDLEPFGQVTNDLVPEILRPDERGLDATLAFCAKEAVQKAIFPACRELLEFHDLSVFASDGDFVARLRRECGPLPAGACLHGRWRRPAGHMLACVFWPSMASMNMAPSFAASTSTS